MAACGDLLGYVVSTPISMHLSCMAGVFDMCVRYTKQRRQFGAPLGGFQLVQERLARMSANIQVPSISPSA